MGPPGGRVALLADECVDGRLVGCLRQIGHDIALVRDTCRGAPDLSVLDLSMTRKRVLLTEDKDFGYLVTRWRRPCFGLILLRLDRHDPRDLSFRLDGILRRLGRRLVGSNLVIGQHAYRLRALSPS